MQGNVAGTNSSEIAVVAGLTPISTYGINNISLQLVPLLATSYSMAFITDPRFVMKVAPINCTGDTDCLSILMPGGLESVRLYSAEDSGLTVFSPTFEGDYDVVVVNNAPSYQVEYNSIAAVDPNFRWNQSEGGDCIMHLSSINDGMYVCSRQVSNSVYVGRGNASFPRLHENYHSD